MRFNLVLPALPEEVIEQIRGILYTVDNIADPYRALKAKLLDRFTPKPLDLCQRIINGGELGDRSPSQLMDSMLALLPPGEQPSHTDILSGELKDNICLFLLNHMYATAHLGKALH